MKNSNDEVTLHKLLDIFIPHLWFIALVSVFLATALGLYSALLVDDTYTSTGKYMVVKVPYKGSNGDSTTETTGLNTNEVEAMQSMIANVGEIIITYDFCQSVMDKLGLNNISHEKLMSMMSIKLCSKETTCYFLSVKSTDRDLAYTVADAAGDLICEHFDEMGYAIKITEIDNPRLPESADSKNVVRNAIIGLMVGFIGCMLIVFIKFKMDVLIKNKETLESCFEYPILGVIPNVQKNRTNGGV